MRQQHPPGSATVYDVIRKDRVTAALTWLKEHNNHYKDIEINKNWHTMISDDELSHILIYDDDNNENTK